MVTQEKNEKELLICNMRINPCGKRKKKKSSLMNESNSKESVGLGFFQSQFHLLGQATRATTLVML